ncbi:ABC transporter permease [Propioniferax innocua]|uniref:Putative ABC transport system permease protein n=1 Tax=Propioniferax innocua TaxID=1753 RepID=A0A542ZRH5_9ACTN|nr:ABC transporter permease [Propioniferax innocua]TQL62953.1 putative ABC transport system permease protein [Propioniferax innocua]
MLIAVELGLIYAVMALGVYLTFRVLDLPDLTVDGSFTTGAATAAVLIVGGTPAPLAMVAAFLAGSVAGLVTGLLHTKGNINGLLAGILTMIGLYSINLRILGQANVSLLGEDTMFQALRVMGISRGPLLIGVLVIMVVVIKVIIDWFLATDVGLALQATGDNEEMIRSFGVSTDRMKMVGLVLSNGLVALCGSLVAQYQGFADIGMGVGLILVGLASVIVGQAIFGTRTTFVATGAVVIGAVIYRAAIQIALQVGLTPNDMKLISAILVVIALLVPQWGVFRRSRRRRVRASSTPAANPTTRSAAGDSASGR